MQKNTKIGVGAAIVVTFVILGTIFWSFGLRKNGSASRNSAKNAVLIDSSKIYQKMFGFGGFLARFDEPHMLYGSGRGNPKDTVPRSEKEKILDEAYGSLYLDSITLGIGQKSSPSYDWPSSWELNNDNNDPQNINWSGFRFDRTYWDPIFKNVLGAQERITKRGGTLTLILKHSWGLEPWFAKGHGSQGKLSDDMEEEYAENLTAFIIWAKQTYGVEASYIVPMNEPDGAGEMSPKQFTRVITFLGPMLEKYNLTTKVAGPETYLPSAAPEYLQAFVNEPRAARYVKMIGYHGYDRDLSVNNVGDVSVRRKIADFAKTLGADVLQGEYSACCKENQKTFWNNTFQQGMAWANDTYTDITAANAGGVDMQLSFWQSEDPSAYISLKFDKNKNYTKYERSAFYYPLAQFINYVRTGMVRIDADSKDEQMLTTAYIDPKTQKIVIVAINNSTVNKEVSFVFASKAPRQIMATRSSVTEKLSKSGSFKIKNGFFSDTIPPKSITTYVSK